MEYKPTFKKNNTNNKDKLRNVKRKEKRNHLHKKEKSKSSSNEKEKKENYIRNERAYNKHLMKNIIQHKYLYKVKDFIMDWYLDQDVGDEEFWNLISSNSHSMFLFLDNKHFRIIQNYDYDNILINPDGGILSEPILEIMFDDIIKKEKKTHIMTWKKICSHGNKKVINILEKNIEKYRDEYGLYYDTLYSKLCENPNATHIIKKYYDSMFTKDCLESLCQNTDPEALSLLVPFLEKMDGFNPNCVFDSLPHGGYYNLTRNPSAISLIKKYNANLDNNDDWALYENPNAIDIIEEDIKLQFYNPSNDDNVAFPNFGEMNELMNDTIHAVRGETLNDTIRAVRGEERERREQEEDDEEEEEDDEEEDDDDGEPYNINSLSLNCNAIHLIENHIEYINFEYLASNVNGIDLIERNLEYIKSNYFPNGNGVCRNWWIRPTLEYRINQFKQNLCSNPNSIEFLKKYPEYLFKKILTNPSIFEINWDYLKFKFNYISNIEEEIINKYLNKEVDTIEPSILLKLKKDYVTQREIEEIINIFKKNKKYLSENELVMQLTTERLIKSVYTPHRVSRNLLLYNYDICQDIYCEEN